MRYRIVAYAMQASMSAKFQLRGVGFEEEFWGPRSSRQPIWVTVARWWGEPRGAVRFAVQHAKCIDSSYSRIFTWGL